MPSQQIDVKCPRCGFHWRPDLSELDRADQVVYRGVDETRDYRVTCPQCGTVKVITVAMGKEGDDG